jgi:uridine kinase
MIRIILGLVFIPSVQNNLFAPFLLAGLNSPLDPWSHWLHLNGRSDAFPYGPIMFLLIEPGIFAAKSIAHVTNINISTLTQLSFFVTILIVEASILHALKIFNRKSPRVTTWLIIFAPLPLFINYVQGQLDVIPTLFIILAAIAIRKNAWIQAGLWIGLGVSAKFSLLLSLPFILYFLIFRSQSKTQLGHFLAGIFPALSLNFIPIFWSSGYQSMVFGTPEVRKLTDIYVDLGQVKVILIPMIYLSLIIWFGTLVRITSSVLIAYIGVSLLAIASAQLLSAGWFYWGIPLIFFSLKEDDRKILYLFTLWQTSILAFFFLRNQSSLFALRFNWPMYDFHSKNIVPDFLFSFYFGTLIFLIFQILKLSIKNGDKLGLSKSPISIAIAGDSGVGKDTLTKALTDYFGEKHTTILLGDDYHRFERHDSSWNKTTHLHEEANDLDLMGKHFKLAHNRAKVLARHYDHGNGKFTTARKINPGNAIILNGLHSHLIPNNELIDLRIFISMLEELRIHLKTSRDKTERGYTDIKQIRKNIVSRRQDYLRFVNPQESDSDLIFRIEPRSYLPLKNSVYFYIPNHSILRELYEALISLTECQAAYVEIEGKSWIKVDAFDFTHFDSEYLINNLVPNSHQIWARPPKYLGGDVGLMATVAIVALSRKRESIYALT